MVEAEVVGGSAVISEFGRVAILLSSVLATQACAKSEPADLKKESEKVKRQVCSKTAIAEVEQALNSLKLEYHLTDTQLNAIKRYNEDQLVSSAITVTVGFDSDGTVTSCKAEILHTGP